MYNLYIKIRQTAVKLSVLMLHKIKGNDGDAYN